MKNLLSFAFPAGQELIRKVGYVPVDPASKKPPVKVGNNANEK